MYNSNVTNDSSMNNTLNISGNNTKTTNNQNTCGEYGQ